MQPTLSPQEFVTKWRKATLKERSAAQATGYADLLWNWGNRAGRAGMLARK